MRQQDGEFEFEIESETRRNFVRGFGETGRVTKIVRFEESDRVNGNSCLNCGYDRMKLGYDLNPELGDQVDEKSCMACGMDILAYENRTSVYRIEFLDHHNESRTVRQKGQSESDAIEKAGFSEHSNPHNQHCTVTNVEEVED